MQAIWKHRRSLVERGASGRFGRRGLPMITLFTVVLPLFAPLLDLMTVFGVFFLDRWITLIGWIAVLVIQVVTAILAFRLDHEPLRPLWALPTSTVRVPADHVRRAHPIRRHGAGRPPIAVAEAATERRGRGARRLSQSRHVARGHELSVRLRCGRTARNIAIR